jgi:hypothetical protein
MGPKGGTKTYSYLELADGKIVRRLRAQMGLSTKLESAIHNADSVELHVAQLDSRAMKEYSALMAIRTGEGPLFASEVQGITVSDYVLIAVLLAFGVATLAFGAGLLAFWLVWKIWREEISVKGTIKNSIKNLPSAVII